MSTAETTPDPSPGFRLFEFLDWKANPVLLRDLRLYMRGKLMIAAYFVTLAILVLGAIAYALAARMGGMDGSRLLYLPTILLSVICGALVPNLVGERFRGELSSRATELALVSPLSPARLVRGKLLGAWCLTLLVVSASAPVFATSYLLGGVTPLGIFGCVGGVLLAGAVMPLPQMYMATEARRKGTGRILFGLVFAGNIAVMFAYATLLHEVFAGYSYRHDFMTYYFASVVIAAILVAQFLYFVTVSRLRGDAENRDAAPRISLAAAALVGGAGAYLVYMVSRSAGGYAIGVEPWDMVSASAVVVSFAFSWGLYILTNYNGSRPRALRDTWEKKPFRRLFLMTGPNSLCAYFTVMTILIIGAGLVGLGRGTPEPFDASRWRSACLVLSPLMSIAYGLVVYNYLVRPFLNDRPGPNFLANTILITNIVLAMASIFTSVILKPMDTAFEYYHYIEGLTPTGLFTGSWERRSLVPDVVYSGVAAMAVLLLLLLPFALRRDRAVWEPAEEGQDAP